MSALRDTAAAIIRSAFNLVSRYPDAAVTTCAVIAAASIAITGFAYGIPAALVCMASFAAGAFGVSAALIRAVERWDDEDAPEAAP